MTSDLGTSTQNSPRFLTAALLSLLSPGLALIHVGQLLAGLLVNLFMVFTVVLFVVAVSIWKFFPLYPFLVLTSTWLILAGLSTWNAKELIDQAEFRRGRPYQHPLMYLLIGLCTFLGPLALTFHFSTQYLFSFAEVSTLATFPQAQPGDQLLIDRTVYKNRSPQRGELVAVRIPQTNQLAILRVVGIPTDTVQMQGYTLLINDSFLDYTPLDPDWIRVAPLPSDMELLVEHNNDRRYVVALQPAHELDLGVAAIELPREHYFLLSDNRTILTHQDEASHLDSRLVGPITREFIEGQPLYITWSTHPQTGSPRWERIGLSPH